MFKLKEVIFDYFGRRDRINDINKDADNKGLHQRFNELLAGDLDDNELLLINLLVENTRNPFTLLEQFLPYREQEFGMPLFTSNLYTRRKFAAYIRELNRRKGTKLGYELMFQLLGFDSATITPLPPESGFDSPLTFDDIGRVFDQKCKGCSPYIIDLYGSLPITSELIQSVFNVIKYNEPINAGLLAINYNGSTFVSTTQITMYVDSFGDLVFANPFDHSFSAWLDGQGNLIFESDFAQFYSLDVNGDLIFTT